MVEPPHGAAVAGDAADIVEDPVEDGVSEGRDGEGDVPVLEGELGDEDGAGAAGVAVAEDFQHIVGAQA